MTFEELLKEIDKTKLGQLSREDIEKFVAAQERVIHSLARENNSLKNKAEGAKQKYLELDGEYIHCRTKTTETKADPTGEAQSDGEKKKKKKKETKIASSSMASISIVELRQQRRKPIRREKLSQTVRKRKKRRKRRKRFSCPQKGTQRLKSRKRS
jgi:hypothetical protein